LISRTAHPDPGGCPSPSIHSRLIASIRGSFWFASMVSRARILAVIAITGSVVFLTACASDRDQWETNPPDSSDADTPRPAGPDPGKPPRGGFQTRKGY
jgi:hypothetical protein